MIRPVLPTDVAAVIRFYRKAPVNYAKPRDRLAIEEGVDLHLGWLPWGRGRRSLAFFHRGRILGLVSARSYCSAAWEVDKLLLSEGQRELCAELLQKLSQVMAQLGVGKLLLNLPSSSPLLQPSQRAGFSCYLTESMYRSQRNETTHPSQSHMLRPKSAADEYQLFQLYNAAVPAAVRSAEVLTFQEWQQARSHAAAELVYEQEGCLLAWLQIIRGKGAAQFEIMTLLDKANLRHLIEHSLALLNGQWPIFCLAPDFQQQLQGVLLERGFELVAEHYRMIKEIAAPAHELQFMPLQA